MPSFPTQSEEITSDSSTEKESIFTDEEKEKNFYQDAYNINYAMIKVIGSNRDFHPAYLKGRLGEEKKRLRLPTNAALLPMHKVRGDGVYKSDLDGIYRKLEPEKLFKTDSKYKFLKSRLSTYANIISEIKQSPISDLTEEINSPEPTTSPENASLFMKQFKKQSVTVVSKKDDYYPSVFGEGRYPLLVGTIDWFYNEPIADHGHVLIKDIYASDIGTVIVPHKYFDRDGAIDYFNKQVKAKRLFNSIDEMIASEKQKKTKIYNEVLAKLAWKKGDCKNQIGILSDNPGARLLAQMRAIDWMINTEEKFIPISFYTRNSSSTKKFTPYLLQQQAIDIHYSVNNPEVPKDLRTIALILNCYYCEHIPERAKATGLKYDSEYVIDSEDRFIDCIRELMKSNLTAKTTEQLYQTIFLSYKKALIDKPFKTVDIITLIPKLINNLTDIIKLLEMLPLGEREVFLEQIKAQLPDIYKEITTNLDIISKIERALPPAEDKHIFLKKTWEHGTKLSNLEISLTNIEALFALIPVSSHLDFLKYIFEIDINPICSPYLQYQELSMDRDLLQKLKSLNQESLKAILNSTAIQARLNIIATLEVYRERSSFQSLLNKKINLNVFCDYFKKYVGSMLIVSALLENSKDSKDFLKKCFINNEFSHEQHKAKNLPIYDKNLDLAFAIILSIFSVAYIITIPVAYGLLKMHIWGKHIINKSNLISSINYETIINILQDFVRYNPLEYLDVLDQYLNSSSLRFKYKSFVCKVFNDSDKLLKLLSLEKISDDKTRGDLLIKYYGKELLSIKLIKGNSLSEIFLTISDKEIRINCVKKIFSINKNIPKTKDLFFEILKKLPANQSPVQFIYKVFGSEVLQDLLDTVKIEDVEKILKIFSDPAIESMDSESKKNIEDFLINIKKITLGTKVFSFKKLRYKQSQSHKRKS